MREYAKEMPAVNQTELSPWNQVSFLNQHMFWARFDTGIFRTGKWRPCVRRKGSSFRRLRLSHADKKQTTRFSSPSPRR